MERYLAFNTTPSPTVITPVISAADATTGATVHASASRGYMAAVWVGMFLGTALAALVFEAFNILYKKVFGEGERDITNISVGPDGDWDMYDKDQIYDDAMPRKGRRWTDLMDVPLSQPLQ